MMLAAQLNPTMMENDVEEMLLTRLTAGLAKAL